MQRARYLAQSSFELFMFSRARGVEITKNIDSLEIISDHLGHVGEASKLVFKHVGPPRNYFKPSRKYKRKPLKLSPK